MVPSTLAPFPAPMPPEVETFAMEKGVSEYLDGVLEMTARVFPGARRRVMVEEDPEIAGDRYLVVNVDVAGLDEDQLVGRRQLWIDEIRRLCPTPVGYLFHLGMEATS